MKLFWFVLSIGLFLFYFSVQAADVPFFSVEMIFNNLYHFFAGFIFLVGVIKLKIKHKFRTVLMLVVGVLILDGIYDYSQHGLDKNYLMTYLYNLYLLFWGTVSGLAFDKSRKQS